MRTHRNGILAIPFLTSVLAAGCFVVDDAPLNELSVRDDAGFDSGSSVMIGESCGAASYTIQTSQTFMLDTAGHSNDVSPSCSPSPGPDLFLKVDVAAQQYWHFHLRPTGSGAATRDPVLHVFPINAGVCNTMACNTNGGGASRNVCGTGGEEHFGVQFTTSGTYAVAVDEFDAASAGGQYTLSVFQPICGNAIFEHGEGCEDNNTMDNDGCDHKCRVELMTGQGEAESNEDRFWANHVIMNSAGDTASVTGMFAGSTCDVDAFAVSVDATKKLEVRLFQNGAGSACYTPANIPTRIDVRTPAGSIATGGAQILTDVNGCAYLSASVGATGGELLVTMDRMTGTSPDFPYRMQFDIVN